MTDDIRRPWIEMGYTLFAKEGPRGLKIEVIARQVNKSKSSFYHHFADLEIFTSRLLEHHQERGKIIAKRAKKCKQMVPDMLHLLLDVKLDILFDRQLRINRDNEQFRKCFEDTFKPIEIAFLDIWSDALGLAQNKHLAAIVLKLTVENFYLQVTEDSLSYDWLLNYLDEIHSMVEGIIKSSRK